MLDILKAALFGFVEGITEWLPVSSTGHMILLEEFVSFDMPPQFWEMFLVVVQLGAIMAVLILYFDRLWPFAGGLRFKDGALSLWGKIVLACIPAAVVGLAFDDWIDAHLYNAHTVAVMLIVFGIAFIAVENRNRSRAPSVSAVAQISYAQAFWIGMFQLVAAVLPGTSRSGATILGGIALGLSRPAAAEFTFFLAVPVMFGASLLKVLKHGLSLDAHAWAVLGCGMLVSFVVSVLAIKFLMAYIKRHDFKVFGWYRIVLGMAVLVYFQAV
ncbi:MAG: undecaprenyl-diphosphate phosphatase [Neisseria sp.]|nr:undecaprenyl-diphosphate phosphatase [Neisseria sp.]